MKLLPGAKVHEAANKTAGRWMMDHVRIRVAEDGQPVLEATDGRAFMVKVPARWMAVGEAEAWPKGEELLVPRDALAELWKGRADEERHILVHRPQGGVPELVLRRGSMELKVLAHVGEFAPAAGQRFPAYEARTTVSFDVEALLKIAKASGAEAVTLEIPPAGELGVVRGAILVRALDERHRRNGAVAGLMPIVEEG